MPKKRTVLALCLLGVVPWHVHGAGLLAEVKTLHGSPTLFVDGKPRTPMMFFGWAGGGTATPITITTEWRPFRVPFIAPEDNNGHCGVHLRVGDVAGTVWVDEAKLYEGAYRPDARNEQVRCGGFEGDADPHARGWFLYVKRDVGAKATGAVDTTTAHGGKAAYRISIEKPGKQSWHVHLIHSGMSVKKGKRYTFTVWLKADRQRRAEISVLRHGPPWTVYSGRDFAPTMQELRLAAQAGIHIHSFGIRMPWPRPGKKPDFTRVDRTLDCVLRADPNGLLLPRFGVEPPAWWIKGHPGHAQTFADGSRGRNVCVSSEPWRREMLRNVRRLVEHCEAKYGDHMLGYHPCAQNTGEWFYPRVWEAKHSGFSKAAREGFVAWLRAKYGSVELLRKAWARPEITFEGVTVPTVEERVEPSLGVFLDPARERRVIDYHRYRQIAMVEVLEQLAGAIKEANRRRKLVVLFYGYYFSLGGLPIGPQTGGHLALARLLEHPDVDILCSPVAYQDRGNGGIGAFMSPVDSVRGHGKLWLNEDDTRTYLSSKTAKAGRVDTPEQTYWVHRRNFGQILPRRLACWYMDLFAKGWLASKDIWDHIAGLQKIYDIYLEKPATWAPEVAVIVDEQSPCYLACNPNVMQPLANEFRKQLYRMGAPFGMYLLSDLVAGDVPPAKAYLFVGCLRLTDRARRAIAEQTRGKTAVWFYGSGYVNERAATEQMSSVVGMTLREIKQPPKPMIVVAPGEGELVSGVLSLPFGTKRPLRPLWAVAPSPELDVMGRFMNKRIAAARRRRPDGGQDIYIGTVTAPAALLRRILASAGVHLYIDSDDVLLTDGGFLCLSASKAGKKRIRFPSPRRVHALPSGKAMSDGPTSELVLDFAQGETRLFRLKPGR